MVFALAVVTPALLNNDAAILMLTPIVVGLTRRLYPGKPAVTVAFAVSVVDDAAGARALPVVEVVPDGGFYDYAARYNAGATEFFVPARLTEAQSDAARARAGDVASVEAVGGYPGWVLRALIWSQAGIGLAVLVVLGFALGNEFSDHVTERVNYLYLAHSKLRWCSFGPELRVGEDRNLTRDDSSGVGAGPLFDVPVVPGPERGEPELRSHEGYEWLYVLDGYEGGLPSARYLEIMADAAAAAGAPRDYVAQLRERPTV